MDANATPALKSFTTYRELETRLARVEKYEIGETRRLRIHLACVSTGIVITVILSYIDVTTILHLSGILAGMPSVAQELFNRRNHW